MPKTLDLKGSGPKYSSGYFDDLVGLRGYAVLCVLLYHLSENRFENGYLGVDIFFVVSGFVITRKIQISLINKSFSIFDFYMSRVKRLLPSFAIVVILTSILSQLILNPIDRLNYFSSLIFILAGLGNFFFAENQGYFESQIEQILLNSWSLNVEEQFYLFFPILMLLIRNLSRKKKLVIIGVCAFLSFFAALIFSNENPNYVFYLLPFRGWELFSGCLIALFNLKLPQLWKKNRIGEFAFVILFSITALGILKQSKSIWILGATVAVTSILMAALSTDSQIRVLNSRIFIFLGQISYSLYLIHFPLLLLAQYRFPNSAAINLMVCLLSILLAWLITSKVENRIRYMLTISNRRILVTLILFLVAMFSMSQLGKSYAVSDIQRNASLNKVLNYKLFDPGNMMRRNTCFIEWDVKIVNFPNDCLIDKNSPIRQLIIGDSHAAALSYGLKLRVSSLAQITYSGCPPLHGINQIGTLYRPLCLQVNNFAFKQIRTSLPQRVILHANWSLYENFDIPSEISLTVSYIKRLSPSTEVLVVGSIPHWKPDLPSVLYGQRVYPRSDIYLMSSDYQQLVRLDHLIEKRALKAGANFYSVLDSICIKGGACKSYALNKNNELEPLVWDYGHLTPGGSNLVSEELTNNDK